MALSIADTIIYKDLNALKAVLTDDSLINDYDEYGFTPLTQACFMNKFEIAKWLLEKGADPNKADLTGFTALHWAVDNHHEKLVKKLLKYKADPNAKTDKSQPILVYPILRKQKRLIKLLIAYKANLQFAQAYINLKLIGHRFELPGQAYIKTNKEHFILVDFEGFFLEFSLSIIQDSIERYMSNFAAKTMQKHFKQLQTIHRALLDAATLSHYQQYMTDISSKEDKIQQILKQNTLLIPAVYQGHAITFIRHNDFFAKCDRGANSKFEGSIVIYRITKPLAYNLALLKRIVYEKQSDHFMHKEINEILGLVHEYSLPILSQVVGNCSWANVEAALPTMLFLLNYLPSRSYESQIDEVLNLYHHWREWDKDRALNEYIQRFKIADQHSQASYITIFVNILLKLNANDERLNQKRIDQIMSLLMQPAYQGILDMYIKLLTKKYPSVQGENLKRIMEAYKKL